MTAPDEWTWEVDTAVVGPVKQFTDGPPAEVWLVGRPERGLGRKYVLPLGFETVERAALAAELLAEGLAPASRPRMLA